MHLRVPDPPSWRRGEGEEEGEIGQPPRSPLRLSFFHPRVPPRSRPCSPLSACVAPQSDVNAMQISNRGRDRDREEPPSTRVQVHYRHTPGYRMYRVAAINGPDSSRGRWPTEVPSYPGGDRARIPGAEPADKFNGRPLNRLNRDSDEIFTCGKKDDFSSSTNPFSIFIPRSSLQAIWLEYDYR